VIRVLQSFEDVGEAILRLQRMEYPLHDMPQKNWDMIQIHEILRQVKPKSVLDMGCGGLRVLLLCHHMGVPNCFGIDSRLTITERLTPYVYAMGFHPMAGTRSMRLPFALFQEDLTKTRFRSSSFDVLLCVSVIEHEVNLDSFFKEASRLLRRGGTLFVSTDYWEPKIEIDESLMPYGLRWNVFSKKEIENLIDVAGRHDLFVGDKQIPGVKRRNVCWFGHEYTFISLVFRKEG